MAGVAIAPTAQILAKTVPRIATPTPIVVVGAKVPPAMTMIISLGLASSVAPSERLPEIRQPNPCFSPSLIGANAAPLSSGEVTLPPPVSCPIGIVGDKVPAFADISINANRIKITARQRPIIILEPPRAENRSLALLSCSSVPTDEPRQK